MKKICYCLLVGCMLACLTACSSEDVEKIASSITEEATTTEEKVANSEETPEVTTEEDNTEETTTEEDKQSDVVTPEFKESMDAYEAFFDEYIEFMEKYTKADANDMVALMADYTEYMKKYTEAMDKMNAINEDELSTADKLYYVEVTGRINTKLMKVAVTQ